jgi:tripartite-type tricarboxylate transporter receptor subunit TctC
VTASLLCGWSVASAEIAEQFYRGKTVTLQIGYGPGGGYDLYARTRASLHEAPDVDQEVD